MRTLGQNDHGSDVIQLQKNFANLGEAVEVNGKYDIATCMAIRRFQAKNGYEVDGVASVQIQEKINQAVVDKFNRFSELKSQSVTGLKGLWAQPKLSEKILRPLWLAQRTQGKELPTFYISGDLGDIIYALPTIRELGGGLLRIGPAIDHPYYCLREPMTLTRFNAIEPLLSVQASYLFGVSFSEKMDSWNCHVDLNDSRRLFREPYYQRERNLVDVVSIYFNCGIDLWKEKWLSVDVVKKAAKYVFARSSRYHNDEFPWKELMSRYGHEAVFVGLDSEYSDFIEKFGPVKRFDVKNLLDIARVIAGVDWFIGNQSSPLAIAEGLKKRILRENFSYSANCIFDRDGHTSDPSILLC